MNQFPSRQPRNHHKRRDKNTIKTINISSCYDRIRQPVIRNTKRKEQHKKKAETFGVDCLFP